MCAAVGVDAWGLSRTGHPQIVVTSEAFNPETYLPFVERLLAAYTDSKV